MQALNQPFFGETAKNIISAGNRHIAPIVSGDFSLLTGTKA